MQCHAVQPTRTIHPPSLPPFSRSSNQFRQARKRKQNDNSLILYVHMTKHIHARREARTVHADEIGLHRYACVLLYSTRRCSPSNAKIVELTLNILWTLYDMEMYAIGSGCRQHKMLFGCVCVFVLYLLLYLFVYLYISSMLHRSQMRFKEMAPILDSRYIQKNFACKSDMTNRKEGEQFRHSDNNNSNISNNMH